MSAARRGRRPRAADPRRSARTARSRRPRRAGPGALLAGLQALLRRPAARAPAPPRTRPAPAEPAARRVRAPRRPAARWYANLHAGAAGRRRFDVRLPAGHPRRTALPVVVLLHGCTQEGRGFAEASRFTEVADRHGFLLVVPHQEAAHQPRRCWRWYEAQHQRPEAGEPAIVAGIVAQVLGERARWRADGDRVYAVGLSAGGALALILAAVRPDVFAAAGVHSAPPFRAATRPAQALAAMAARLPAPAPAAPVAPLVIVQGMADRVVAPRNGELIADQWLASRRPAVPRGPRVAGARRRRDRGHRVLRWSGARGRTELELWLVDDLGHAWSGGRPDEPFSEPGGPRAATLMWRFLRRHRLGP